MNHTSHLHMLFETILNTFPPKCKRIIAKHFKCDTPENLVVKASRLKAIDIKYR